jgi:hypothetical protein
VRNVFGKRSSREFYHVYFEGSFFNCQYWIHFLQKWFWSLMKPDNALSRPETFNHFSFICRNKRSCVLRLWRARVVTGCFCLVSIWDLHTNRILLIRSSWYTKTISPIGISEIVPLRSGWTKCPFNEISFIRNYTGRRKWLQAFKSVYFFNL